MTRRDERGKNVLRSGGDGVGVPIVIVLCGGAWTELSVLWRLELEEWKLVPLVRKRGGRRDGQQGKGAYHARFILCLIRRYTPHASLVWCGAEVNQFFFTGSGSSHAQVARAL